LVETTAWRLRNAAHRHGVGGVGAGAPRCLDETLRQRAEGGLIEQIGGTGFCRKRRCRGW